MRAPPPPRRQWLLVAAAGAGAAALGGALAWRRHMPAAGAAADGAASGAAADSAASGAVASRRFAPTPAAQDVPTLTEADRQRWWAEVYERPEGGGRALRDFLGAPLVVNFWATWCPPCKAELPEIDAFARRAAPAGWQVLGLAIDRIAAVRQHLAQSPLGYPQVVAGHSAAQWVNLLSGQGQAGLPLTALFSADGVLLRVERGATTEARLREWLPQGL